jgi:hypothetical protein
MKPKLSRKYKLFLTMAEQSTAQQEEQRLTEAILANVGTVVCFRTGNPKDEQLFLPLFQPFIKAGEIANLSAYKFYAKLSAVKSQEPLSGETLLLDNEGNKETAEKVIKLSRKCYAKKVLKPKKDDVKPANPEDDIKSETDTNEEIIDE